MAELCAPNIETTTLSGIISVESGFNPFAIGVVGGRLERQPRSLDEAVATADALAAGGYNYSLGLAQVNKAHFLRFGLTSRTAFDPCTNLRAGAFILKDCYDRAPATTNRLGDALSCYNSGNFHSGYSNGYVTKVMTARLTISGSLTGSSAIGVVPDKPYVPHRRAALKPARGGEALLTVAPSSQSPAAASAGFDTALLF